MISKEAIYAVGRKLRLSILAMGCLLAASTSDAASIKFGTKTASGLSAGDVFSVDLFAQGLVGASGGGFDLGFDSSVIASIKFTCDAAVWSFDCGNAQSVGGQLTDGYVATFNPQSGDLRVGTLAIKLAGEGTSLLEIAESASNPWASSDAAFLPSGRINPIFEIAKLSFVGGVASISAVPVPAAGYLFVSASAALFGLFRKRKDRSAS